MHTTKRPIRRSFALIALALALTSCSSDDGEQGQGQGEGATRGVDFWLSEAQRQGFEEQAEILSDGVVTAAEYEGAIDNTLACYRAQGYSHSEPRLNPVDSLTIQYTLEAPGTIEASEDTCEGQYSQLVQTAYVTTNVARIEPALLQGTRTCMEDAGVEPGDAESYQALRTQFDGDTASQTVVDNCIVQIYQQLYPGETVISLSY